MESRVAASLEARQLMVILLGFFAASALLMATLQSMASSATRCPRGPAKSDKACGWLWPDLSGLARTILFSRWFGGQLFTVSPFDPRTFVAVAAVLILAALPASYIPAA